RYPEEHRERFLTIEELERLGAALRLGISEGFARQQRTDQRRPKAEIHEILHVHAAAAIRLLLFTGARKGEILSLKWEYVDIQRRLLLLPDSKTGAKSIVLNAPALEVLAALPRVDGNPYVIAGKGNGPLAGLKRP